MAPVPGGGAPLLDATLVKDLAVLADVQIGVAIVVAKLSRYATGAKSDRLGDGLGVQFIIGM